MVSNVVTAANFRLSVQCSLFAVLISQNYSISLYCQIFLYM